MAKFTFDTSKFKSPKQMDDKIRRALFGTCKHWDGPVETYARNNAPWTDRTGNARSGLQAQAARLGKDRFAIVLSHRVPYGIYLERKNDEQYAIIMPTIRVMGPKVASFLTKLMDRLDKQAGS